MRSRSGARDRRATLPKRCPVNFDFSIDRIECKTCKYFETCLRIYNIARRIASRSR